MRKTEWAQLHAPTIADFDRIARAAFSRLPAQCRQHCANVLLIIEDFPDDDVIAVMTLESPFEILGLYQGVDLTQKSLAEAAPDPDVVYLYRRPILDVWAEGANALDRLITHVLVHEIGHHFGLSDDDMEAIENEAALGAPPQSANAFD